MWERRPSPWKIEGGRRLDARATVRAGDVRLTRTEGTALGGKVT